MERKIIYLDDAIDALRYAQHRFTVADEAGGMGTVKWSEDVIYFAAAERVLSELPSAQPEPKEGHWILRKSPDGGEQYECSECGVLWEFIDGTPEDNEAYFCPNCGAKMDDQEGESKS